MSFKVAKLIVENPASEYVPVVPGAFVLVISK
jgi:hypothetical protein